MKKTTDLGKDKVPLLVLKLAVPSMIAQFVNVLYSTVDRMFIGNIPRIGDEALAGVGVCGPIVTLLTSFGTLIGLGGSILMAMRMGAGRKRQAENILAHSFVLLVLFSALLTFFFLLIKGHLLNWFGASDTTFPYADSYMTIYTAGTFFALMAVGLNYFITCQGFPGIGMLTVIIGALTNILLDPVFIFGFHMNVAGAAIATVIAQFVSCAFAFRFLTGKKIPVKITLLRKKNFSPMIVQRILVLGVSPFLILATDSVILIVLNTVLQTYGGPEEGDLLITCATIVQSYMMLITGPMLGISSGTQAILSYNYGAKNIDRVKSAEKIHIAAVSVFYNPDVSGIQDCPGIFHPYFYPGSRTDRSLYMGDPCIHSDDHSSQLPICICRWLYSPWKKPDRFVPFRFPERRLHTVYHSPSHILGSQELPSTPSLWQTGSVQSCLL